MIQHDKFEMKMNSKYKARMKAKKKKKRKNKCDTPFTNNAMYIIFDIKRM